MSQYKNHSDFIQTLEHDDYSDPETKRVSMYGWDSSGLNKVRMTVNPDGSQTIPTGASTSANQTSQITLETTLNSLTETLQELVQRLAPLAGAMAPTAQLRVTQTAVPSTAVTGPITSAQSIAEKNLAGVMYTMRVATENLNAVQSNINNCIGA